MVAIPDKCHVRRNVSFSWIVWVWFVRGEVNGSGQGWGFTQSTPTLFSAWPPFVINRLNYQKKNFLLYY